MPSLLSHTRCSLSSLANLWLFLRAKTSQRTLTISQEGIATNIGTMSAKVPWHKVAGVTDSNGCVFIVGVTGNSFFIPSRAFAGPHEQAQFVAKINYWRNAEAKTSGPNETDSA